MTVPAFTPSTARTFIQQHLAVHPLLADQVRQAALTGQPERAPDLILLSLQLSGTLVTPAVRQAAQEWPGTQPAPFDVHVTLRGGVRQGGTHVTVSGTVTHVTPTCAIESGMHLDLHVWEQQADGTFIGGHASGRYVVTLESPCQP